MRPRSRLAALAATALAAGIIVPVTTGTSPVSAIENADATVFINELHYDNTGADTGEFVEIAGPAGTDLTGWRIVLYNGNGGAQYGDIELSGSIPDQDNGFGALSFSGAVIQNGSPDGLALLDPSDNIVEFLSYEGVFAASDGPVADQFPGEFSTDIAVSEPGNTPIGQSLQRVGTGTLAGDFTWTGPADESPGAVNGGQNFGTSGGGGGGGGGGTPPAILINEVDADNPGTDDAEFLELTDGGAGNTPLDGLAVVLYDGSNDQAYNAFDLDGLNTGPDGYFVLCVDAGNVANCDLDIAGDDNEIQNGADAIALYEADAADFPTGTTVTTVDLIDALVYDTSDADADGLAPLVTVGGQIDENANGNKDTESNSRCPDSSGEPRDTSNYLAVTPTPGAANDCGGGGGGGGGTEPQELFIHEIQGDGDASPFDGQLVTISGIVVGDFQEIDAATSDAQPLGGFFVQEEDADADGNAETSEGIFVFAPDADPSIALGDLVEVTGTVDEFFDLTQITDVDAISVIESGLELPTAATPTVPTSLTEEPVDWEAIEGMRVEFDQPLFASNLFTLRFGEVGLSSIGPWDHPNQVEAVGSPEAEDVRTLNLRSKVVLDDGSTTSDPSPTPYLGGPDGTLRAGDRVDDLAGVVTYSFGEYKVAPVNPDDATDPDGAVTFDREPRPTAPPDVGGDLTVASFNVLNYFVTIDETGVNCGPPGFESGCRGADTDAEFDLQSAKIADAIADLDADIVGLIELENSENDEAIVDLVGKVNALSDRTYDYIATGYIGTDVITVGMIYDVATVEPLGDFAVLDSTVSPAFIDTKNRPVLAQTFTDLGSGETLTIANSHMKSKGSDCADVENPGDPDFGVAPYATGEDADVGDLDPLFTGNCNLTRTAATTVLGQWIADNPTGEFSDNLLLIGDLNAYANEEPITVLEGQGYTDLKELFNGGDTSWAGGGHSYVFGGEFGTLDYALANDALLDQVTGAEAWHINADEPFAIDYQNFNPPGQATEDEWKSSDHDPVLIGLSLAPAAPTCNGLPATIVGTDDGEVIIGTNGPDVIVALGGRDVIDGRRGADVICAGDGGDIVFASSGRDTVDAGEGNDVVFASSGADTVEAGPGADWVFGGSGGDTLDGGAGFDVLLGGFGVDTCTNGEAQSSCEL